MQDETQKMHAINFNTLTKIADVLLEDKKNTGGLLMQLGEITKIMNSWAIEFGKFAKGIE